MNAWNDTPPASWPRLSDIMAETWVGADDIDIPVISLSDPQGAPAGSVQFGTASGHAPHAQHMVMLAGLTMAHASPGSNIRVAAARDDDGLILVTCHRLAVRDAKDDWPAGYRAYRAGGALHPCCQPDGDDRQQLCGNLPEPGSRHCATHQDHGDARRRMAAWQNHRFRHRDERDPMVRAAFAVGITKHAIYVSTGIARTTIDKILNDQEA